MKEELQKILKLCSDIQVFEHKKMDVMSKSGFVYDTTVISKTQIIESIIYSLSTPSPEIITEQKDVK